MTLPDTLSCFRPKPGPEIALDIAIHHAHLSPVQREAPQLAFEMDVEMHALADIIIFGWPDDIKEVPCPLCPYWQHCELMMDLCFMEKPSSSLHQKGRRSLVLYTNHAKTLPKHSCLPVVVFSGLESTRAIEETVSQCEKCMIFQAQNAATLLTPTPTLSCPWQICALDIFTLDGVDYLILADFYSKVILVHNLSAGQSNSTKVIHILEEWFCDHGMPEVLCTDNSPQYANAVFADCSIE